MSTAELQALAADLDGAPPPGSPPVARPSPEDQAAAALAAARDEAAPLVDLVHAVLEPFAPDWAALYTPAHRARIAETFAALCLKHGWDTGGILEKFGEEIAFGAAIVLPIGGKLAQLVRQSRAPVQEAARAPAAAPAVRDRPAANDTGHSTAPVVLQPAP